jgi:pilus assembly protein CpaB
MAPWPDVDVPETYFREGEATVEEVAGAVLRPTPSPRASRSSTASSCSPGDRGFLAAVLEPGMRAVSVAVDEAAANAGLIFPATASIWS